MLVQSLSNHFHVVFLVRLLTFVEWEVSDLIGPHLEEGSQPHLCIGFVTQLPWYSLLLVSLDFPLAILTFSDFS